MLSAAQYHIQPRWGRTGCVQACGASGGQRQDQANGAIHSGSPEETGTCTNLSALRAKPHASTLSPFSTLGALHFHHLFLLLDY